MPQNMTKKNFDQKAPKKTSKRAGKQYAKKVENSTYFATYVISTRDHMPMDRSGENGHKTPKKASNPLL